MKEYFLKRALPFALTFAVGAAVGGFIQLLRAPVAGGWFKSNRAESRRGCGKKFRRAYRPAPESRAPIILFKPDARIPTRVETGWHGLKLARVRVTFGDDGKVRAAEALNRWSHEVSDSAERAARQIQFIPATLDGAPTTVTEEVEIRFSFE
jgi:hypothetical protein